VCESFPAARLVVVGDGPEAGALRGVAVDAGVSECVVWVGRRSQQEAWRLLPAMDAVAVPSRCEGFGLAAAEAQAAGLPVVASDVDGLPEVVRDGEGGILVGAESPSLLAGALCSLLGDRDRALHMGRAGQRHVAQSFSRERFSASIAAAYRLHAAPADAGRRVS
jgi:glycosyltransferase involved in cell wall biosynthesis